MNLETLFGDEDSSNEEYKGVEVVEAKTVIRLEYIVTNVSLIVTTALITEIIGNN